MMTVAVMQAALLVALLLAVLGAAFAYHYGRSVGFDEGVRAARRIHESGGRGDPADRAL